MRRRLLEWGAQNRRCFPWRETDDPFQILIAEILLQRTRADAVAPVYRDLFTRWPTAKGLAQASVESIQAVIRPLGLSYRASRIVRLAEEVARLGAVPADKKSLIAMPGVGGYVANATLAAAFSRRVPTVDGVSARVYRRFFDLPAERLPVDDRELWSTVEAVTPHRRVREWNWAVLDLAASTCTVSRPRCAGCPLRAKCATARPAASRLPAPRPGAKRAPIRPLV